MKKDYYLSADGKTKIAYFIFEDLSVKPKAVLQISHGMKEFMLRYKDFADYFNKYGIVVLGNDALGHGDTMTSKETAGYFADKNGEKKVLKDLHTMSLIAKEKYPNLPIYMFGHSMGSFFARYYASVYPGELDGFIFCGTSSYVKGSRFGLFMMNLLKTFKGKHTHFTFIDKIMTKKYFRYIPNPKYHFEWVTSNPDFAKQNDWDGRYKIDFTVGAYYDMVKTIIKINKKSWAKKLDKDTPIMLISGSQDPVGQYGQGVCEVYKKLENEKINSIDLILYAKARHEPFEEIRPIKDKFFTDLLYWLNMQIENR